MSLLGLQHTPAMECLELHAFISEYLKLAELQFVVQVQHQNSSCFVGFDVFSTHCAWQAQYCRVGVCAGGRVPGSVTGLPVMRGLVSRLPSSSRSVPAIGIDLNAFLAEMPTGAAPLACGKLENPPRIMMKASILLLSSDSDSQLEVVEKSAVLNKEHA